MSDLVERLRDCAEDPMWDAHAEIPKIVLAEAAARIETLEAVAQLSRDLLIELDTYWSGISGPSLSDIMLDWRNKYRILLNGPDE